MKPTLHIYPAKSTGWDSPRVYTFTVWPEEALRDTIARSMAHGAVATDRDDVFDYIFYPAVRESFHDIVIHQQMLHPSL